MKTVRKDISTYIVETGHQLMVDQELPRIANRRRVQFTTAAIID